MQMRLKKAQLRTARTHCAGTLTSRYATAPRSPLELWIDGTERGPNLLILDIGRSRIGRTWYGDHSVLFAFPLSRRMIIADWQCDSVSRQLFTCPDSLHVSSECASSVSFVLLGTFSTQWAWKMRLRCGNSTSHCRETSSELLQWAQVDSGSYRFRQAYEESLNAQATIQ